MKRISLIEEMFKSLVRGEVVEGVNINDISKEKFIKLVSGDVIEVNEYQITLQDIGYDRIFDILMSKK